MSRFADVKAARTVQLGPCECPGTPHAEGDWVRVRADLSGSDIATIAGMSSSDEGAAAATLAPYVLEWNLLGPDGEPWPPEADTLYALRQATLALIVEGLAESIRASSALPNASGAPSRATSRGSASRTPTTPRKR